MVTPAITRGAVALARVLRTRKLQQVEVAKAVHAHKGTVCHWLRGSRLPGRDYARKLERLFGIRVEWWEQLAAQAA